MNHPLSEAELRKRVPALFGTRPAPHLSDQYVFTDTWSLVQQFTKEGWVVDDAQQRRTRNEARAEYTKFVLRLHHPDIQSLDDARIQALIVDSHDGLSKLGVGLGAWRFACSNGLFVGDTFFSFKISHRDMEAVGLAREASINAMKIAPKLRDQIAHMRNRIMMPWEQSEFATKAHAIKYTASNVQRGTAATDVPYRVLLERRRREDKLNDLWHTFNVVQENCLKGGQIYYSAEKKQERKTRPITSIDREIEVNKRLWMLAEEYVK